MGSLFDSLARGSINPTLFGTFGEPVVYRRGDGSELSLSAVVGPYDGELQYLESGREVAETRVLTVLRDEYCGVTEPQEGVDEVEIRSELWRVRRIESATDSSFRLLIERAIRETVGVGSVFGK